MTIKVKLLKIDIEVLSKTGIQSNLVVVAELAALHNLPSDLIQGPHKTTRHSPFFPANL
jgi:hypothetical protein